MRAWLMIAKAIVWSKCGVNIKYTLSVRFCDNMYKILANVFRLYDKL